MSAVSLGSGIFAGAATAVSSTSVAAANDNHDFVFALISAGAAVVAAILGPLVTDEIRARRTERFKRKHPNTPPRHHHNGGNDSDELDELKIVLPLFQDRLEAQDAQLLKDQETIALLEAKLEEERRAKQDEHDADPIAPS